MINMIVKKIEEWWNYIKKIILKIISNKTTSNKKNRYQIWWLKKLKNDKINKQNLIL